MYKFETFAELYQAILTELANNTSYSQPRGELIKEMQNVYFELTDPAYCIFDNQTRSTNLDYLEAELDWYFSGDRRASAISAEASLWDKIKNQDGTVNSNYGFLVFYDENIFKQTQFGWAYQCLLDDKDTRQAIIHFNNSTHQFKGVKDFPCTMYGIYSIRDDTLNLTMHMRSLDVIFGLPYDIVFFYHLLVLMYHRLHKVYPELKLGKLCQFTNSMHLYKRHFNLVNEMLKYDFEPVMFELKDINSF